MTLKNHKQTLKFVRKDDYPCSDQAEKQKMTTGHKQNKTDQSLHQWCKQEHSAGISIRTVELQAAATSLNIFSGTLIYFGL
jgi:hypothetical protein